MKKHSIIDQFDAKTKLEYEILDLITEYEKKYKLNVIDLAIERVENGFVSTPISVRARIEL